MPEVHAGVQRVTAELRDGRTVPGVEVAWANEIIGVAGHSAVPFEMDEIVGVYDESGLG